MEVYESCNTENKSEQMDDILDFLNGLIEKHVLLSCKNHEAFQKQHFPGQPICLVYI